MSHFDTIYLNHVNQVFTHGNDIMDRTGVGTRELFSQHIEYGMVNQDFPLLTVKPVPFKSVLSELLWFIEGSTHERRLAEILYQKPQSELKDKRTIWTDNLEADYWTGAKHDSNLGNIYGKMWRAWPQYNRKDIYTETGTWLDTRTVNTPLDQLDMVIEQIKTNPFSRRHIITAWNPGEQTPEKAALPPCHYFMQFNVEKKQLNLLVNMRSNDIMLGAPFNIASYALLLRMVAQVTKLQAGRLSFTIGSAHIYSNHFEGAKELLSRRTQAEKTLAPMLLIDGSIKHIDDFKMNSFELRHYFPLEKIPLPMAV